MPTVSSGVRGTTILNTETRRVRDVSSAMARLEPDAGPLVTLMGKISGQSEPADAALFEWFEDELLPKFDVLNGALTAGATTMTVTNFVYFRIGDLVRINKAEIAYVSATPTTTTVTITRAYGETAAAAASVGDQLHIIGNSNEEGTTARGIISTQRIPVFNYCQIFRHPFGVTNTQKVTKQYGGQDLDEETAKNLIEHKKEQ